MPRNAVETESAEDRAGLEGELLGSKQAAAHLGKGVRGKPYALQTFYNMRASGEAPAPDSVVRGKFPRWRRSTLDRWIADQVATATVGGDTL